MSSRRIPRQASDSQRRTMAPAWRLLARFLLLAIALIAGLSPGWSVDPVAAIQPTENERDYLEATAERIEIVVESVERFYVLAVETDLSDPGWRADASAEWLLWGEVADEAAGERAPSRLLDLNAIATGGFDAVAGAGEEFQFALDQLDEGGDVAVDTIERAGDQLRDGVQSLRDAGARIEDEGVPVEIDAAAASDATEEPAGVTDGAVEATVIEVIDGDTFRVEIATDGDGRRDETVRMVGIDTPESDGPYRDPECYGREASQATEDLLLDEIVWLQVDVENQDRFGRWLRYVWLVPDDGGDAILVNEELVRQGVAESRPYAPNLRYQDRLDEAEQAAVDDQAGFWGACGGPDQRI